MSNEWIEFNSLTLSCVCKRCHAEEKMSVMKDSIFGMADWMREFKRKHANCKPQPVKLAPEWDDPRNAPI